MPLVKICGITNLEDARLAVRAGANYLGLNFFPASPRFLEATEAEKLAREIKTNFPDVKLVGVFVNETSAQIEKIAELALLDVIQLHGDESPDFLRELKLPTWKAFRVLDRESLGDLDAFLEFSGIVLDAYKQGLFGGTGATADWEIIRKVRAKIPFLILAGGITPENVRKATRKLTPEVIDVCSGVERADDPRRKDPAKIHALFEALRNEKE